MVMVVVMLVSIIYGGGDDDANDEETMIDDVEDSSLLFSIICMIKFFPFMNSDVYSCDTGKSGLVLLQEYLFSCSLKSFSYDYLWVALCHRCGPMGRGFDPRLGYFM
jgi:hypothetical protein